MQQSSRASSSIVDGGSLVLESAPPAPIVDFQDVAVDVKEEGF